MKFSLRKANAIKSEIIAAQRDLPIKTRATITEFENPESVIRAANESNTENFDQWTCLNTVLFEIRKKVGHANTSSGISDTLAALAEIDSSIANLREMSLDNALRTDPEILVKQIEKIKAISQDSGSQRYGYGNLNETIETGIFSDKEIKDFKTRYQDAKRQKQDLKDKLLHLNLSTEIELSETNVAVLVKSGIIQA